MSSIIKSKNLFSKSLQRKIWVAKILETLSNDKNFAVSTSGKKPKIDDKPDILLVKSKNKTRKPNLFVIAKETSTKNGWLSMTEEQFNTMKRSAGKGKLRIIYFSDNYKSANNLISAETPALFLKKTKHHNGTWTPLANKFKIDLAISADDFEKISFPFEIRMHKYKADVFNEKERKAFYTKDLPRKDIKSVKCYKNFNEIIKFEIQENQYPEKKEISEFKVKGSFNLIRKNKKLFIECLSDVSVSNDIFGEFRLNKGSFYNFHLSTLGRDPQLKRNNLFISKNRVYQLIASKKIANPDEVILNIAKNI